jgi:hypothetical protein
VAKILKRSILFVGFMVLTGCNDDSAIRGVWIHPDGKSVIKIDSKDFDLHVLGTNKALTFAYEKVDDGEYVLVNRDMSDPTGFVLNEDNTVLTLDEKNLSHKDVRYVRPPNVSYSQLHGAWEIKFSRADAEEVVFEKHIMVLKPNMKFDFYGISTDEQLQLMTITTSKNKSHLFDNGFMLGYQQRSGDKKYGYYILNIKPDEIETVFKTGRKAIFKRINFEGIFDVPEGYNVKLYELEY